MKPRIAFVVNGTPGSAMSVRASEFASRLQDEFQTVLLHRELSKVRAIRTFVNALRAFDPDLIYVMDLAFSGVLSAIAYRLRRRRPWILDTGDEITAHAKSVGGRGWLGERATAGLEWLGLHGASSVVVRGTFHQQSLEAKSVSSVVIQDGVDTQSWQTTSDVGELRAVYGLNGFMTVGILGSSIWSEKLQRAVGWELVEMLPHLRELPVKAVLIGDGTGIPHLRKQCEAYGVSDRMVFIDRVPYENVSRYLQIIDIAVSTQTNDVVGWARTTGKLPLYMASGRYILATDVGEATLVLPECMRVPYEGVNDPSYPERLAGRVRKLLHSPDRESLGVSLIDRCKTTFDYGVLSERLRTLLHQALAES